MRKFMAKLLFLAAIATALMLAVPAFANDGYGTVVITGGVVTDNQTSTAIAVPRGVEKAAIYVPTITSATISLKGSHDGGTTYDDVFCLNNGTNVVLASSAAGTGGMMLELGCNVSFYSHLKVYAGAAQAADRTFTVIWRKHPMKSNQ